MIMSREPTYSASPTQIVSKSPVVRVWFPLTLSNFRDLALARCHFVNKSPRVQVWLPRRAPQKLYLYYNAKYDGCWSGSRCPLVASDGKQTKCRNITNNDCETTFGISTYIFQFIN